MTTTLTFSICNTAALTGWLFLLIVPNWKYTLPGIVTLIVFLLSLVYMVIIVQLIPGMQPDAFSSLPNIKHLFQNNQALLAGWVHYLAFDLFVGTCIVQKAKEQNIPRWLVTLILPFTFLFGPLGYALFQTVAYIKTGKPS